MFNKAFHPSPLPPFPWEVQGRTPPSPGPFPLVGEGENIGNLGVWGSRAAPNTQISGFYPPFLPVFWGEKGGRGDERGYLSAPERWEGGKIRKFRCFGLLCSTKHLNYRNCATIYPGIGIINHYHKSQYRNLLQAEDRFARALRVGIWFTTKYASFLIRPRGWPRGITAKTIHTIK